jgi:cell division protein FtsZ
MVEYDRSAPSEARGKDPLNICIAGVGGAGSNVLDRISIDRSVDAKLVTFQSDIRVLNRTNVTNRVQLGTDLMRGVGAGGDPDLGREAALFSKNEIRDALDGHEMVFISAGLGGGTGSGAAPVIAEIAKSTGAIVVVFATVPFSFEGRRRGAQASEALDRLAKSADALILFDNNRMGELVLPKEGIQKAFAQGDQLIAQSVRAVTSMVGTPGLVKLGLDDLVAALRVSEGRCLFGFGEAKGQNRGTEALKRALKSPLINSGELLGNAKNLLVHVVGGESLTLAEVEQVMKQLGRHVPDETQILFGVSVEPKLGETITVTLVSALSARELATARREPEQQSLAQPAAAPEPVVTKPVARQPQPAVAKAAPVPQAPPPPPPPALDDLFVSAPAHADEVEEEVAPAPAPQPVVEVRPAPVAAPAPVTRAPAAPAPVPEEVVYEAAIEETAPEPPREPTRDSARVRLLNVVNPEKTVVAPPAQKVAPPVDEVRIEPEPAPQVVAPMPETVRVPVSRPAATQVRPAATAAEQPSIVARTPETAAPQLEPKAPDLFGGRENVPVAKKTAPVEQPSLRLGTEERGGRFKDTEPSFAAQGNEDLDTPTWMRLRRRVTK